MKQKKTAFTLIEMLVVIAMIGLLAAILVPAVTGALDKAARKQALSNGTSIYKSVFGAYTEEVANLGLSGEPAFATSNPTWVHTTSSEYFTALCDNDIMSVDWSFFRAGKIPAQQGRSGDKANPALLTANNAWAVVEDADPEQTGALFMFTRNVADGTLGTGAGSAFTPSGEPFGTRAVIGISMGGGAVEMSKSSQYNWGNLNPGGDTNNVLRP